MTQNYEHYLIESLCGNATEDVIIDHDVRNFPDFIVNDDLLHACTLKKGENAITIFNVNRRPAEVALGVDLIYKNDHYNSFTFVQYKMLDNEGGGRIDSWRYRPDAQFDKDIERMKASRVYLNGKTSNVLPGEYRLSPDPFFFKFCRRQHLKVNAGMLARGHYFSLSHLELIMKHAVGPRGGRLLDLGKADRWLTRSQFAPLVAEGWVGTTNITDQYLKDFVENSLSSGNSVLVAVGKGTEEFGDE